MSDSSQGSKPSQNAEVLNSAQAEAPINNTPTQSATPQTEPEGSQAGNHVQPNAPPRAVEQVHAESRSDLLARARTFLSSPQVQNQDMAAKRAFLAEKGLNASEIERLLSEMACHLWRTEMQY